MRAMFATLMLGFTLVACTGETPTPEPEPAPAPAPDPAPVVAPQPDAAEVWRLDDDAHPALRDPTQAALKAPASYKVKFVTTKGDFIVHVTRDWAPMGADRLYNLVEVGFFDQIAFFRAVDGFMAQFGISGYPEVSRVWREAQIQDDEVKQSNTKGRVTFATAGKNTRTTQLFINYRDNSMLDGQGFSPIGEVVEGMDIVDSLYKGYGDAPPRGKGPNQGLLQRKGNAYLKKDFPELDYIESASIVN